MIVAVSPSGSSPTRHARTAMVSSPDRLASEAGVALLRAGGSAVDAAVAAAAVLAVTAQDQCGLGGDLWAVVHRSGDPAPAALNASGHAGSGADPERLRAEGHASMPERGDVRSVPVPGCVDGWLALHARGGRRPLAEVLEPARAYAADGFPMSAALAEAVPEVARLPGAAGFLAAGSPRPGTVVAFPGLAWTLGAIAARGRDGFYAGEAGTELLALGAGEFSGEDLARVQADWVEPLGVDVWGRRLWTVPPNSQGYVTLAAAWIAAGLALPDPADGRWAHLLVEAVRQAGHDRDELLHEGADGAALLAPERLAARRDAIDPARASAPVRPAADGGTVAVVAVDAEGLGVSLIQSNFAGWGAQLVLPGTGIFLHSRGTGFSLAPGHPAGYAPGRRPPHTLSPLVATRDGGTLECVLGTRGGHGQPDILLQLLARRYAAGESPTTALAAPRWVRDGNAVALAEDAPADWRHRLGAAGHQIALRPGGSGEFGRAEMISAHPHGVVGASDPRSPGGAAVGYDTRRVENGPPGIRRTMGAERGQSR